MNKQKKNRVVVALVVAGFTILLTAWQGEAQPSSSKQSSDVLMHLNAAINWYKNLTTKVQAGTEPRDAIYLSNAEEFGGQVVRLAFQSARAQAELDSLSSASANTAGNGTADNANGSSQRYAQMENEASQRIADDELQIAALKQKGARAGGRNASAQEEWLGGKLALDKASLDAVRQMEHFVEESNLGGTGLKGNINDLARSVPEVLETQTEKKASPGVAAAKTASTPSSGLLGQLILLYGEVQNIRSIEQRIEENDNIQSIANNLRAPLRDELRGTLQQEKDLATQTAVTKQQYDALTHRFKEISAALLPLNEEVITLDQSRSNLVQWRKAHTNESRSMLESITLRVTLIFVSVGLILGLAEVWRRLTFRYVRDPRRRRQFLVLRRFVMGFLIGVVVVMGFASEFSSLATYAGFVTAGIAVGLQAILLSAAAYFFVIGRYGISVGDRVSVAGVTGDVIDVGLVRFYLMEFAAAGADLYPTGRIAVFSNSVLFQATTPLFKQLPGTRFTWHEAVIPLGAKADYVLVQNALESAIGPIYKEYNLDALWQRSAFDPAEIAINPPAPENRVRFGESGPEIVARYPVDLNRAPEIDDKITRALMDAIHGNEALASAVAGAPKIRSVVKS